VILVRSQPNMSSPDVLKGDLLLRSKLQDGFQPLPTYTFIHLLEHIRELSSSSSSSLSLSLYSFFLLTESRSRCGPDLRGRYYQVTEIMIFSAKSPALALDLCPLESSIIRLQFSGSYELGWCIFYTVNVNAICCFENPRRTRRSASLT
jgi:hypothetical protein